MQSQWPSSEELEKLATTDPEALEALRQQEVEILIQAAPENMQRRLRGLQFQIDAKRHTSKSPLAACIAISEMMFSSVYQLNDALNGYGTSQKQPQKTAKAQVIDFPSDPLDSRHFNQF